MADEDIQGDPVFRPPRDPSSIAIPDTENIDGNEASRFVPDLPMAVSPRPSNPNPESISLILSTLERIKTELIQEVRSSNAKLATLMQAHCGTRPGTPNSRATGRGRSSSGIDTESETRKRAIPDADDVTDVYLMATKENAWLRIMRFVLMYTVLSFSESFKSTRHWITARKRANLFHVQPLCVKGVSGLSLIYFSVAVDDLKSRYDCPLGKAWSALCTDVIVSILMSARIDFFSANDATGDDHPAQIGGRPMPDWLQSFGGKNEATRFVQGVVEHLERTNQLPVQKKYRKEHVALS